MDYVALGTRIKNKRLEQNYTQEQLAELVDVSAVYIGQIERGDRKLTLKVLVKIAESLNVSIEELLKDSTITNLNSRILELNNLIKTLDSCKINKIIEIVKILYK